MANGRHALAPRIIRAWRVFTRPAVLSRVATALLLALAAMAGSLMVLATERGDRPGLVAGALLGVITLAAISGR